MHCCEKKKEKKKEWQKSTTCPQITPEQHHNYTTTQPHRLPLFTQTPRPQASALASSSSRCDRPLGPKGLTSAPEQWGRVESSVARLGQISHAIWQHWSSPVRGFGPVIISFETLRFHTRFIPINYTCVEGSRERRRGEREVWREISERVYHLVVKLL